MAGNTPLRFQQPAPPAGPLHLRFGASGGVAPGDATVALHGRITGLRGHVGAAAALAQARLHGRITGLRGHMGAVSPGAGVPPVMRMAPVCALSVTSPRARGTPSPATRRPQRGTPEAAAIGCGSACCASLSTPATMAPGGLSSGIVTCASGAMASGSVSAGIAVA